jgi:hypothetical protein
LDNIEDAAFDYHTQTGDVNVARGIKRDLQQIVPRIVMARRGPLQSVNYSKPLAAFRKSITFDNFESAQFVPKSARDPFFDEIAAAKRDLIMLLEQAYGRAYA